MGLRPRAARSAARSAPLLKNFYSSKLPCICSSLLETNLNKAEYSVYYENCQEFLASQVPVLKRNKATNSSTSNHPFSAAMKTFVLGNLFKLFRPAITFAREVYHLGIKMKIALFFSLSPTANCPCECDGKS